MAVPLNIMAPWIDQPEDSGGLGGIFFFLIDDTHFFLIDNSFQLIIDDTPAPVTWIDQVKN